MWIEYHNQKILQTLAHDIRKHWTAVSTLLGLICSVYCDLPSGDWTSDYRMQSWNSTTEPVREIMVYTADET